MGGTDYQVRFINDPIHGSMGFSQLELDIIESPAFRRLRNVRQLGLADYVYPTASYSRFAHSLGVCHLAGRFMSRLSAGDSPVSPEEIKLTRLAALTHDIGHYPFSHSFEHAIKVHYQGKVVEDGEVDFKKSKEAAVLNHEAVSERVLLHDPEITRILEAADIDPLAISQRFRRESASKIGTNVISSDFDVDRTDYLLRTAHAAGLPYGQVDLDYIIGVLRLAKKGEQHLVAIPNKAMRAVEHFLLGRFFDYQTVAYHKTVTVFERLLEEAIGGLLGQDKLDCRAPAIEKRIQNRHWSYFDDAWLTAELQKLLDKKPAKIGKSERERQLAVLRAILERRAPKLIAEVEFFSAENDVEKVKDFENRVGDVLEELEALPGMENQVVTWINPGMKLTKIGTLTRSEGHEDRQDADQLVHVRLSDGDLKPLIEMPRSLMHVLSNYRWYCARFYSLNREEAKVKSWRQKAKGIMDSYFDAEAVTVLKV